MPVTHQDISVPQSDTVTTKLPNALTLEELVGEGKTVEQAHAILADRVFGVNHGKDAEGKPIERGHGSPEREAAFAAKHPGVKSNHVKALELAEQRKAQTSGVAQADVIAAAVAAGVQAGLAAAKNDKDL